MGLDVPAACTLAGYEKKSITNYDMYLRFFRTYLDFKVLSDQSGSILNGIIEVALQMLGASADLRIFPGFGRAIPYTRFISRRAALRYELLRELKSAKRSRFCSNVIDGLSYDLVQGAGVPVQAHEYSPEDHGRSHHVMLYRHYRKFHLSRPVFIVLVDFPWFGERVPEKWDMRTDYYRALARTFFERDPGPDELSNLVPDSVTNKIRHRFLNDYLDGVFFLADDSVTSSPDGAVTNAYFYENETAITRSKSACFRQWLRASAIRL